MHGIPEVSVVIPTHNRAPVLRRAIESAFAQSVTSIEVIVVDDASTDSTREVVESYLDPRLVYLRLEENSFAAAARNAGMQRARGRYIAFLDSDDEWLESHLENGLMVLRSLPEDWGCTYSGAFLFKNDSKKAKRDLPRLEGNVLKEYIESRITIWTPTFIFRRSCLERIGLMDTKLVRAQDRDFYIRMLSEFRIAMVREPTVRIYLETKKPIADIALESRIYLLQKHDRLLRELGSTTRRHAYAMQWNIQAQAYFSNGEIRKGLEYWRRSIQEYPFIPIARHLSVAAKCIRASLLEW